MREKQVKPYPVDSLSVDDQGKTHGDDDVNGDEMVEMLHILQEFQKRKSSTVSVRTTLFHTKLKSLIAGYANDAEVSVEEGSQYFGESVATVKSMREHEPSFEEDVQDLKQLCSQQDESILALRDSYPSLLQVLSPRRVSNIDSTSMLMEHIPHFREKSRRKIIKNAKSFLDGAIENQKIVADASVLIRHYKALLQS